MQHSKDSVDKKSGDMGSPISGRTSCIAPCVASGPRKRDRRVYQAAHYQAHKEEKHLYSKVYYQTHKQEIAARCQANKKELRVARVAYCKTHKEEKRIYDAAYYKANKKKIFLRGMIYREDHKEEIRIAKAAYRQTHSSEFASRNAERKAKIRGSTVGDRAQIKEIYRRAKEDPKVRCYLCNKLIPLGERHVDHILPLSKEGPTRPSNLAIACSHCNLSKGSKHPNEIGLLI